MFAIIKMFAAAIAGLVIAACVSTAADAQTQPPLTPDACQGGVLASVGSGGAGAPQRCLRPKNTFQDCQDVCPEMVVVPAGTFTMGSPADEKDRFGDEGPAHQETIGASFAVGKLSITRGQFTAFVNESGYQVGPTCYTITATGTDARETPGASFRDPGFPQDPDHPAVCISWDDAKAYVAWLSKRTGKTYRLLTEAEYEYADRAGTQMPYWFPNYCDYANSADATAKARFPAWPTTAVCKDGYIYTAPGGSFAPNDFGLYDMAGNAWSWTEDCYNDSYNGAPRDGSAWIVGGDCSRHVLRGGAWDSDPRVLRSAYRIAGMSGDAINDGGFRIARTLLP
jgi:formylglycine-generating enzyme required for sulfatase activity